MRNGQNKRMRGRNNNHNHRKSHNPLARVYESNGPEVKIRGNPAHIAEKYVQLARDAHTSGDPVSAENYYQHAEHYFRLIAAAQEQFRQNNPHLARTENDVRGAADDMFDDEGDEQVTASGPAFGNTEQPYMPRETQPFQRDQSRPPQPQPANSGDVDRLPTFITGGAQPQPAQGGQGSQFQGQNGHDKPGDRFPLHRRRRRHRGPRNEMAEIPAPAGGEDHDDSAPHD